MTLQQTSKLAGFLIKYNQSDGVTLQSFTVNLGYSIADTAFSTTASSTTPIYQTLTSTASSPIFPTDGMFNMPILLTPATSTNNYFGAGMLLDGKYIIATNLVNGTPINQISNNMISAPSLPTAFNAEVNLKSIVGYLSPLPSIASSVYFTSTGTYSSTSTSYSVSLYKTSIGSFLSANVVNGNTLTQAQITAVPNCTGYIVNGNAYNLSGTQVGVFSGTTFYFMSVLSAITLANAAGLSTLTVNDLATQFPVGQINVSKNTFTFTGAAVQSPHPSIIYFSNAGVYQPSLSSSYYALALVPTSYGNFLNSNIVNGAALTTTQMICCALAAMVMQYKLVL